MNFESAINQLLAAGLMVQRVTGHTEGITGGNEKIENPGIAVYKNAFSVYLEDGDNWLVRYPGVGQLVQEVSCANLQEAVNIILDVYGLKTSSKSTERRG